MGEHLRIAHYPQIPCEPFYVENISDLQEASRIINILADYDLFQFENHIKPDYSNVCLLEKWNEEEQKWEDWSDEETGIDNVDEYLEYLKEEERCI